MFYIRFNELNVSSLMNGEYNFELNAINMSVC